MENKITITQEELSQLQENQEILNNLVVSLGQTELQIYALENQVKAIKAEYDTVIEKQEKLSQTLSSKYGDGAVNIETGEFTPAS